MQARPSRCPAQLVSLCSRGGGSAPPSGPAWVCTHRSQQPYSRVPLVLAGLITGVQGGADWVLVSDCVQCDTLAEHRPEQQKTRSCAFCFDEGMWEELSRLLKKPTFCYVHLRAAVFRDEVQEKQNFIRNLTNTQELIGIGALSIEPGCCVKSQK